MTERAASPDREHEEPAQLQIHAAPPLVVALLALGGMAAIFSFDAKAAAGGWLTALAFWSSVTIGSLAAVMIHTLTGGRWGTRFAPVFVPCALATPLIGALFAPVLAEPEVFYPWTHDPTSAPADVSHLYLNVAFFIARTAAALCFWTLIAFLLTRLSGRAAVLTAAIGLAIHGLIIGIIGVDWILSLEPVFISTSFGATLAFTQLAAAFAWAVIISPGRRENTPLADLGGLLLATLLGITYMNFIAVLVIWYGDLPHKVSWFVHRDHWPWTLVAGAAFVLGSVVPIFSLFLQRVRASRRGLRIVGVIVLAGIAFYYAYLIGPSFGVLSLGSAFVAIIAVGALLVAFVGAPWARAAFDRWSSLRAR
jgi:hypothetical protein